MLGVLPRLTATRGSIPCNTCFFRLYVYVFFVPLRIKCCAHAGTSPLGTAAILILPPLIPLPPCPLSSSCVFPRLRQVYGGMIGEENLKSKATKMAMWAAASGSAEIFADVALVRCRVHCCFEEQLQTQPTRSLADSSAQFSFACAFAELGAVSGFDLAAVSC